VTTHPGDDRAERTVMTPDEIAAVTIGTPHPVGGPIELAEYDPRWPARFAEEAARLRYVLGDRVLVLEHAGSTSVPGLAAKPIIDMVLAVADSADEAAYVPVMEAAGYVLRIREPEWFEHRVFKGPGADINLHVFSAGCPEIARMLQFRDLLRSDAGARGRYEQTKRELAARDWEYVQNYADAKTAVIEELLG
jgi:GrpB-like predicted nucleotidyltransferase (UPF0157 family)